MAHQPMRLLPPSHYGNTWMHSAPAGTTADELLVPGYWSHVATSLRVGDEVIVLPEDMAWRAHLFVRAVGRVEAVVRMLSLVALEDAPDMAVQDSPYEAKFRGPVRKWEVINKSDGAILKQNADTREEAEKWLKSHMTAMAR